MLNMMNDVSNNGGFGTMTVEEFNNVMGIANNAVPAE